MIKKIMILFILFLSGCSVQRITEVLFIASIGIEESEEGYCGYFYLPNSEDIGKANYGGSGSGEFAKFEGKNLSEIFGDSQSSTELTLNLRHSSSLVLNKNLLKKEFIEELISFIKYSTYLDLNFYIFITEDKLEDIYSFQNPNKESVLNSILVSTFDSPSIYLSAAPVHFLEFCRDFYENKCIKLPYLKVEKIWNIQEEEVNSYHCSDMVLYKEDIIKIIEEDIRAYYMKKNSHFYDIVNENNFYIEDYDIKIKYKKEIVIDISCKYTPLNDNKIESEAIAELINNRVYSYLDEFKDLDPLNIEYYNNVYMNNYSYDSVNIKTDIRLF